MLWCRGYHYCATSYNKVWTQVLCRFKPCLWHVGCLWWWEKLVMYTLLFKVNLLHLFHCQEYHNNYLYYCHLSFCIKIIIPNRVIFWKKRAVFLSCFSFLRYLFAFLNLTIPYYDCLSGTMSPCFMQKCFLGGTACDLLNTLFTLKLDAEKGMISSVIHIIGYSHLFYVNTFTQIFLKSIAAYLALTESLEYFHFESIFVSVRPGFIKGSLKSLVDTIFLTL